MIDIAAIVPVSQVELRGVSSMSVCNIAQSKSDTLAYMNELIEGDPWFSQWIEIDQDMIDRFASATLDDQWIHTDPERAKQESEFGTTIAHGYLSLSLTSVFAIEYLGKSEDKSIRLNYGFNHLRLLAPVMRGDKVRGKLKLKEVVERKPGQLLATVDLTVEIKNKQVPALVGEWLVLTVYQEESK